MFALQLCKPHRRLLALVAICYLCLSIVLPLQHTDHFALPLPSAVRTTATTARSTTNRSTTARSTSRRHPAAPTVQTAMSAQDRCAACEWQAAHVSSALPAFTLALTPTLRAMRVITTFPRYLRLLALPASSRAPPHA